MWVLPSGASGPQCTVISPSSRPSFPRHSKQPYTVAWLDPLLAEPFCLEFS